MARGMSRGLEQFVVPIQRVDVEDQGAAGVRVIGHVSPAAGQPPHEPCIDGAEEDLTSRRAAPQTVAGIQQVADLRAREVGVDHQARFGGKQRPPNPRPSNDRSAGLTRLCQTMAFATGRPVSRSQRIVVSR